MLATIDFETERIEGRPSYPPKPVGVAIKIEGCKPIYLAWGHPVGNNTTKENAIQVLASVWSKYDLIFQNGKFDIDVAEVHMDMVRKHWSEYHDTMFLIYLDNPHADTYSLKPAAQRILGMPPDEQEAVRDWLLANSGLKLSVDKRKENYWAGYICLAPGDLVGKYAIGDVVRTERLFMKLYDSIVERGMLRAYDVERELCLCLLDMERQGLPIDHDRLAADVAMYTDTMAQVEAEIYNTIGVVNINSGAELMKALMDANLVDSENLMYTKKGNVQTNKAAMTKVLGQNRISKLLAYRSQLYTCLNTFMIPWLKQSTKKGNNWLIYTKWNQVKGSESGFNQGTKTGRMSSTPNFQNIPNKFDEDETLNLPPLPKVRSYVIAFAGDTLFGRDYSQQELRILAHYEDGVVKAAYDAEPHMDFHTFAQGLINSKTGRNFERKPIKNTGFGLIYGMGLGTLAMKSNITVELAAEVKKAYLDCFPGLKVMYKDMKYFADNNIPIHTWSGREYFCEPPALVDGRMRSFDYRMVNKLIQGSAADCTKEAILRFYRKKRPQDKLLLSIHDELVLSSPDMLGDVVMSECMESVEFNVPMFTDGHTGNNLSELK